MALIETARVISNLIRKRCAAEIKFILSFLNFCAVAICGCADLREFVTNTLWVTRIKVLYQEYRKIVTGKMEPLVTQAERVVERYFST